MSDSDSEVDPRHEMLYHTKSSTSPNRNTQIAFKSVFRPEEVESSEYGIVKTVSFIMKELKKRIKQH